MYSFYACGAQKHKKGSQMDSLFMLLGFARAKAAHKYVGEIDPQWGGVKSFLKTELNALSNMAKSKKKS